MENKKFIYVSHSLFDRQRIHKFLEEKAQQGWLVKTCDRNPWVFQRIEPCRLHFYVSYLPNKEISYFQAEERRREYIEYCRHAGWELAANRDETYIWYHRAETPVPIDTDPEMELENIHRHYGKGTIRLGWIGFSLFLVFLCLSILLILDDDWLVSILLISFAGLSGFIRMIAYYCWRKKALRTVKISGVFPNANGILVAERILVTVSFVLCCLLMPGTARVWFLLRFLALFAGGICFDYASVLKRERSTELADTSQSQTNRRGTGFLVYLLYALAFLLDIIAFSNLGRR